MKYFILSILIINCNAYVNKNRPIRKDDTLVLTHVLFRHGQRTPDPSTIYPNDPYRNETYYPYGLGALTNEGKATEYNIGKALRERYRNFLGIYMPNKVHVQASPIPRTKLSAQLVLASLFPPIGIEKWNPHLNWQPIDYEYNPRNEDLLFLHGLNCDEYVVLSLKQLNKSAEEGEFGNFRDISEYLSYHSGWTVDNPEIAFNIYSALLSEEEWGFELPEWTEVIYPEPLHTMGIQYFADLVKTDILKKLSGGFLLRRIIEETNAKLNGSASMNERRISLYAGHDFTIVALLGVLGVFKPHHPPYGSYVILEIHKLGNNHGVKVFYHDYSMRTPQQLTIPNCGDICPFDRFKSLYSKYLPTKDMCNNKYQ